MNKNKLIVVGVVVAIVLAFLSFTGVGKQLGAVLSSEQTFDGGALIRYVKYPVAKTLTAATNTLTVNDLNKGDLFKVDTTSNVVVVNFPTVPSDFVGRRVKFVITAGTNALSMHSMNGDALSVVTMALNGTDATPDAIGDFADCVFVTTAKATCIIGAK
ncbi:MAG: hypothetical protein NUV80_01025 [Candidatus Berkelbacteria bacterium]|nr:hypothetical protein [Candidatus Berkelbacteria bacterium]